MPTMIQTVSGRVTGLWGKAVIRGADGKMRPLKMGDYVVKGDMILTTQDGIVQLTPEVTAPRVAELEIEPPGAGAAAGTLLEGLRLGRVIEATTVQDFSPLPVEERARISTDRDPNLPPYGNPFSVTTPEDVPVAVPLRGFDADGRVVSVVLTRVPPTGVLYLGSAVSIAKDVQVNNPNAQATPKVVTVGDPLSVGTVLTAEEAAGLVFLPTPNFKGNPGGITFYLIDNEGARSQPIDVTISVLEVNDAPVAPSYNVTTPEDTPIPGQVRGSDVDDDPLTYAKASDPSHGTVTVQPDGSWLYTPNPDYNGPDEFKVTVSDGRGGTDTSTVSIVVTPVDDTLPPAGTDAIRTTPEDTAYIVQVNDFGFSDPNPGDTFTAVRIDSIPARGSFTLDGVPVVAGQVISVADIDAGKLAFIADPDDTGNDYGNFTFSVRDSSGAFDPVPNTFTFNVTPVNDTPVAGDDRAITPEDTPIKIDVLANDSDADVGDVLRIIQVNGSPVSVGSTPVPVTDAGGITVGVVTLSPDQQLVFTPAPNYVGPANFDYTITDGLTPVKGQVRVDVTPVNDPPVANPDNINTLQGTPVNVPVRLNDTDVENDPLTVTAVTQGTRGTVSIDPTTGNPVYTPNPGTNGPDSFTYTITDGNGGSSTTTVTVNVGAVNQAPAALPDTGSTNEDTTLVRGAAQGVILGAPGIDSDPDGNSLTVTRVALGANAVAAGAPLSGAFGVLTLNADGSYAYAPSAAAQALKAGESRDEVFTYTVADPSGLSATTTLTITVTGVNDGPVAVNDRASTPEDTPVTIRVLGNDTDPEGDKLSVIQVDGQPISVGSPVGLSDPVKNLPIGSVALNTDGTLTFTPVAGYNGTPTFTYTITDGQLTSTATVNLIVDSVNDPPVANPDLITGLGNTLISFDPRANDTDPDTPKEQLSIVEINGSPIILGTPVQLVEGQLNLKPDGTLSFTPIKDFSGVVNFDYTLSDGALTDVSQVRITIVDDRPGVQAVNNPSTVEGGNLDFTVTLSNTSTLATTLTLKLADGTATLGTDTSAPLVSTDRGLSFTAAAVQADGSILVAVPAGTPTDAIVLRVPTVVDILTEDRENLSLAASTPKNGAPVTGIGTIDDGNGLSAVSITGPVTIDEAAGTATYTVTLTNPSTKPITVAYATADGTAVAGLDYTATTGTLSFAPNELTKTVTVAILNDKVYEISENFSISLSAPTNAVVANGSVLSNIVDDGSGPPTAPPPGSPPGTPPTPPDNDKPVASITGPVTIDEAAGTATYTVTLTNPSTKPITVAYATADGTAVAGSDYTATSGTLTFAPNELTKTVTVAITNDRIYEISENFSIALSAPTNATIGVGSVLSNIVDDGSGPPTAPPPDSPPGTPPTPPDNDKPVASITGPVTIDEAAGTATYTVTLTNPSTKPITVAYATADGTAVAGSDYTATSGTLTFAPNELTKTVTVAITNDRIYEISENFSIALSAPTNATIGVGSVLSNIVDDGSGPPTAPPPSSPPGTPPTPPDNDKPVASITGPVTIDEAAGTATYTVTLTNPSTKPITVAYATADGTAVAGSDYTATSGTLTFAPNELTKTVTVAITNDRIYEISENFSIALSAPTNATIGVGSVLSNIVDDGSGPPTAPPPSSPPGTPPTPPDNDKPVASITGPVTIDEAAGTATYTVTLTNPSTKPITVAYATADGTAVAGSDYTATSGTLTFAPNELSKTVTVAITNDRIYEISENFSIALSAPTNATIGVGSVLSNIVDDGSGPPTAPPPGSPPGTPPTPPDNDKPVASITGPVTIDEAAGTATYTVTLTNPSTKLITVAYATADGTAVAGSDYTATSGTLTFAPNELTKTVTVAITNDRIYEISENFSIALSAPTNATIGVGSVLSNIVDDGSGPPTAPPPDSPPGTPPTPPDNDKPVASITGPVTIDEAAGTATYTVTLTNPSTKPITVAYATADGTAVAGSDYTATSGTLTFAPNELTKTVTVAITNDRIYEISENFSIALSAPTNATIGVGSVLSNIVDDGSGPPTAPPPDSPPGTPPTPPDNDKPVASITGPVTIDEAAGTATYTVTLTNPSTKPITVAYATADGTAVAGSDYTATSGTLTFAPNELTKTVTVAITNDRIYEISENFSIALSAPTNATIGVGSVLSNIVDDGSGPPTAPPPSSPPGTPPTPPDNDKPVASITGPVTIDEAAGTATYTVTLTNPSTKPITVAYATADGTAVAGSDYTATSGTLTFAPNELTKTVTVAITNDRIYEISENFSIALSAPTNATIGVGSVLSNIVDDGSGPPTAPPPSSPPGTPPTPPDNDKPVASITGPVTIDEAAGTATYTVTLTNPSTKPITVAYATADGTAVAGSDYTATSGTLTFAPNELVKTITVGILGDNFYEAAENFRISLSAPTNATIGTGSVTTTIVDDDRPSQGNVPTAQESALATGTNPALTTEVVTGKMVGTDTTNANFSWTLSAPAAGAIKSGGVNVVWTTSADGKTVSGTVADTVGGVTTIKPVATITISNTGDYTFTLQGPIDHPAGGTSTQTLPIDFTATANTGIASTSTPLVINVQDDQPGTVVPPTDLTSTIANTNLMFVLDLSGSMNQASGIAGLTRLQAAVDSVSRLIDKYDALGETTVRLVTFNNLAAARDGAGFANVFLNLGDPAQKTALTNLLASIRNNPPPNDANTNYDAALGTAIAAWAAGGKIAGAQNVSYFLSDGLPTAHSGSTTQLLNPTTPTEFTVDFDFATNRDADTGIQAAEELAWTNFLTASNLQSYAIGIGTGIAGGAADLATVAYDGQAQENRNGTIVTDFNQLDSVLAKTLPAPISGNLVGSLNTGAAGADGGIFVKSIVIAGVSYVFTRDADGVGGSLAAPVPAGSSFDAATGILTVNSTTTTGARFVVDFDDGTYRFETPQKTGTEAIAYTLSDRDGDVTPTATLQILVDTPAAAENGDATGNTLDGDARFNTLFGNAGNDTLNGQAGNDKLFGNAGDDRLDGGIGNDELSGGAGNDTVIAGLGNDFVSGGAGNDTLTGGAGSDVFAWRFADQGTAGAGRALDTISDFDVAPVAQGGDVLDLRDLLSNEAQGAGGTVGNLSNYLDINVVGGSTEIRISTTGGFAGGTYAAGSEDQRITLSNVDLSTALVPGQTLNDAQIIETLLKNGKLITD